VNAQVKGLHCRLIHRSDKSQVQLSVFECEVRNQGALRDLRAKLRDRIDTLEDQVRLYPTTAATMAERYIIGARTVEERADYWIVR
jgi:CRISPR-associated protein Cas2